MSGPDNSLRAIDGELRATLEYILELEETHGDAELLKEARGAVEEYKGKLAKKVDGYAGLMRQLDVEIADHESELKRIAARKKQRVWLRERLDSLAKETLEHEPKKKLEGGFSTLKLSEVGGSLGLDKPVPAMIPGEYLFYNVRMGHRAWKQLLSLPGVAEVVKDNPEFILETEARDSLIKADLLAGIGVPGCCLKPRGTRVSIL